MRIALRMMMICAIVSQKVRLCTLTTTGCGIGCETYGWAGIWPA